MNTRPEHHRVPRTLTTGRHQRGTALIMSLVILMILTILGVTAMGTATLEERMAGNTQELNKAFQAAESGLTQVLDTAGSLDLNVATTNDFTYAASNSSASVTTEFVEFTPPKRGSGHGSNVEAANFDQSSTGLTGAGAKAVVHQGVAQIVPKAN
ncbi:MAG: hypothetical protein A2V90_04305 [Gammaproteobacteria bacterium RBG_16_57_12]|nr:MAG: hypothetical protein A2V90_04305 [Gammaproteobacteria bacterium RBG_16_57_12]